MILFIQPTSGSKKLRTKHSRMFRKTFRKKGIMCWKNRTAKGEHIAITSGTPSGYESRQGAGWVDWEGAG